MVSQFLKLLLLPLWLLVGAKMGCFAEEKPHHLVDVRLSLQGLGVAYSYKPPFAFGIRYSSLMYYSLWSPEDDTSASFVPDFFIRWVEFDKNKYYYNALAEISYMRIKISDNSQTPKMHLGSCMIGSQWILNNRWLFEAKMGFIFPFSIQFFKNFSIFPTISLGAGFQF